MYSRPQIECLLEERKREVNQPLEHWQLRREYGLHQPNETPRPNFRRALARLILSTMGRLSIAR